MSARRTWRVRWLERSGDCAQAVRGAMPGAWLPVVWCACAGRPDGGPEPPERLRNEVPVVQNLFSGRGIGRIVTLVKRLVRPTSPPPLCVAPRCHEWVYNHTEGSFELSHTFLRVRALPHLFELPRVAALRQLAVVSDGFKKNEPQHATSGEAGAPPARPGGSAVSPGWRGRPTRQGPLHARPRAAEPCRAGHFHGTAAQAGGQQLAAPGGAASNHRRRQRAADAPAQPLCERQHLLH
jgi:hypothetical protein